VHGCTAAFRAPPLLIASERPTPPGVLSAFFLSCAPVARSVSARMTAFLYRCPNTGFQVQGYSPEQTSDDDSWYEAITCLMCKRVHLVNPTTGKVLGEEN